MTITELEAIPPITPNTLPFISVSVRKKEFSRVRPNFSRGHLEVKEVAAAAKKEEVTNTIIVIVNRMKRTKPGFPKLLRAIWAIDFPPSWTLMKREVKSWTAPNRIPPKTIQSQPGTAPYKSAMVGPAMAEKW